MTITVAFDLWELEYLAECIPEYQDYAEAQLLRSKLVATRDLMRQHEAARIAHDERQRKLWDGWEIIKRREP